MSSPATMRLVGLLVIVGMGVGCGGAVSEVQDGPPDASRPRLVVLSENGQTCIEGARIWTYVHEVVTVPAGGRWVSLGQPCLSNAQGVADLPLNSQDQAYAWVLVSAPGYRLDRHLVRRSPEVVRLDPADPFTGTAWDVETSDPVANATVSTAFLVDGMCDLCGHNHVTGLGPTMATSRTDAMGSFRLTDGGDGGLLCVECPGFATVWKVLTLSRSKNPLMIRLQAGQGLDGTVTDPDGHPVANVAVTAQASAVEPLLNTSEVWVEGSTPHMHSATPGLWKAERPTVVRTDADGRFRFEGLRPDTPYRVWSQHEDALGIGKGTTSGASNAASEVLVRLRSLAAVTVEVTTKHGGPVKGESVYLWRQGRPAWPRHGVTGPDGRAQFDQMLPGRYLVAVGDPPRSDREVDLPAADGQILFSLQGSE